MFVGTLVNNRIFMCNYYSLPILYSLDEEPPVFTCPEVIEQMLPSGLSEVSIFLEDPPVVDNSGIVHAVSSTRNSGDSFSVGEYTVEYAATDEYGNEGTCLFRIIVHGKSFPFYCNI